MKVKIWYPKKQNRTKINDSTCIFYAISESLAATKPEIAKLEAEEAISATELFFRQMDTVHSVKIMIPV